MQRRACFVFLLLALTAARASAQAAPARKNEAFAWAGGAGLDSTTLFGATYGRYLRDWLLVEGGLEFHRGDFSGQWLRLNALFSPPSRSKLRPYFLAGSSDFYPEIGGGLKLRVIRGVGARVEATMAADDDEGWYPNVRAGLLLAF